MPPSCRCGGGPSSIVDDPFSNARVCTLCGSEISSDDFQHQLFTSTGVPTSSLHRHKPSTSSAYHELKTFRATATISNITARLGLSQPRPFADVTSLINDVTDRSLGDGDWFPILVASCCYIVARKRKLPLTIYDVAAAVGSDPSEIGKMTSRVCKHLGLPQLPEFDIVKALEKVVDECPHFGNLDSERVREILGQARFVLQCAMKWFITTGRMPMPVVAAVVVFVAEVNGVQISVEEFAGELGIKVCTVLSRLKELRDTLIKVARVLLPWGKDVNLKNLALNGLMLIRFMEARSKSKSDAFYGLRLDDEFEGYLNERDGEGGDDAYDSNYFKVDADKEVVVTECKDLENMKLSGSRLAGVSKDVAERIAYLKKMGKLDCSQQQPKKRRKVGLEMVDWSSSWDGRWDSDKELTLEQIFERDVGYDSLPPSFVAGLEKVKRTKSKIEAAKRRINAIINPDLKVLSSDNANNDMDQGKEVKNERSKRKHKNDCLDWEDFIIELLLLHRVKESEIEKGYYRRLVDLYVFSG